jgi:hypothetical protein
MSWSASTGPQVPGSSWYAGVASPRDRFDDLPVGLDGVLVGERLVVALQGAAEAGHRVGLVAAAAGPMASGRPGSSPVLRRVIARSSAAGRSPVATTQYSRRGVSRPSPPPLTPT